MARRGALRADQSDPSESQSGALADGHPAPAQASRRLCADRSLPAASRRRRRGPAVLRRHRTGDRAGRAHRSAGARAARGRARRPARRRAHGRLAAGPRGPRRRCDRRGARAAACGDRAGSARSDCARPRRWTAPARLPRQRPRRLAGAGSSASPPCDRARPSTCGRGASVRDPHRDLLVVADGGAPRRCSRHTTTC